jgi:hypothetical protein
VSIFLIISLCVDIYSGRPSRGWVTLEESQGADYGRRADTLPACRCQRAKKSNKLFSQHITLRSNFLLLYTVTLLRTTPKLVKWFNPYHTRLITAIFYCNFYSDFLQVHHHYHPHHHRHGCRRRDSLYRHYFMHCSIISPTPTPAYTTKAGVRVSTLLFFT